jgi:hypothetical protein
MNLLLPRRLVEVSRKEPAGFVKQERINSYRLLPIQMLPNNFVAQLVKHAGLPIDLLMILWATGKDRLPVLPARRIIAPRPILHAPPLCVNVLPPAEQGSKERDLCLLVGQLADLSNIRGCGQAALAGGCRY